MSPSLSSLKCFGGIRTPESAKWHAKKETSVGGI